MSLICAAFGVLQLDNPRVLEAAVGLITLNAALLLYGKSESWEVGVVSLDQQHLCRLGAC